MKHFYPEGILINSEKNKAYLRDLDGIKQAKKKNITLEALALSCDNSFNLKIDIKGVDAYISKEDVAVSQSGAPIRDIAIISRVGRPVCFKIVDIDESFNPPKVKLSRVSAINEAKNEYLDTLQPGDIIPAKITHFEPFGAFVDLGCGNISLIGIENISVSRIEHPSDRFSIGEDIFVIVVSISTEKINLSHKELLGTWTENASKLVPNSVITGIIRSIESYGIFVEIMPNLSGLAEYKGGLCIGDSVSVHIKSISAEKMKIKLNIIGKIYDIPKQKLTYFKIEGNMKEFLYSPENCKFKTIYKKFI